VDTAASDLNLAEVVDDHLAGWSPQMLDQLQHLISTSQFVPFADALARVANCARQSGCAIRRCG
jgi:hypothetical protein